MSPGARRETSARTQTAPPATATAPVATRQVRPETVHPTTTRTPTNPRTRVSSITVRSLLSVQERLTAVHTARATRLSNVMFTNGVHRVRGTSPKAWLSTRHHQTNTNASHLDISAYAPPSTAATNRPTANSPAAAAPEAAKEVDVSAFGDPTRTRTRGRQAADGEGDRPLR